MCILRLLRRSLAPDNEIRRDSGSPAISPRVIHVLKNLQDDENDPHARRWLSLDVRDIHSEDDARFVVTELNRILVKEHTENTPRITGLELTWVAVFDPFTETRPFFPTMEELFCNFIQQTPYLSATCLNGPSPRLLRALHTNTSVEHLLIYNFRYGASQIGHLLRHKTNLSTLRLSHCSHIYVSNVLPFLHRGFPQLRKLGFSYCFLGDDGVQSIIQALIAGNHHVRLEELDLNGNNITSRGLSFLCTLKPSIFSLLRKLILSHNPGMLDDQDITQQFIQDVLLSQGTCLEELSIMCSGQRAQEYVDFIKALETNITLACLDVRRTLSGLPNFHPLRDQLVESLPKMKGVKHLLADWYETSVDDTELVLALRRNTSLYKLSKTDSTCSFDDRSAVRAIMKRNEQLRNVDRLLGSVAATTATTADTGIASQTTTRPTDIPRSLWSWVLANVGQGSEGASPVFKVLQAQLANWPESMNVAPHGEKKR